TTATDLKTTSTIESTTDSGALLPHHEYHPDDIFPGVSDPRYNPDDPLIKSIEDTYYGHPVEDHLSTNPPTSTPNAKFKPHHKFHPDDIFHWVDKPTYDPNDKGMQAMEDTYYGHPISDHYGDKEPDKPAPNHPHFYHHLDDIFPGGYDREYDPDDPDVKAAEDAYYEHPHDDHDPDTMDNIWAGKVIQFDHSHSIHTHGNDNSANMDGVILNDESGTTAKNNGRVFEDNEGFDIQQHLHHLHHKITDPGVIINGVRNTVPPKEVLTTPEAILRPSGKVITLTDNDNSFPTNQPKKQNGRITNANPVDQYLTNDSPGTFPTDSFTGDISNDKFGPTTDDYYDNYYDNANTNTDTEDVLNPVGTAEETDSNEPPITNTNNGPTEQVDTDGQSAPNGATDKDANINGVPSEVDKDDEYYDDYHDTDVTVSITAENNVLLEDANNEVTTRASRGRIAAARTTTIQPISTTPSNSSGNGTGAAILIAPAGGATGANTGAGSGSSNNNLMWILIIVALVLWLLFMILLVLLICCCYRMRQRRKKHVSDETQTTVRQWARSSHNSVGSTPYANRKEVETLQFGSHDCVDGTRGGGSGTSMTGATFGQQGSYESQYGSTSKMPYGGTRRTLYGEHGSQTDDGNYEVTPQLQIGTQTIDKPDESPLTHQHNVDIAPETSTLQRNLLKSLGDGNMPESEEEVISEGEYPVVILPRGQESPPESIHIMEPKSTSPTRKKQSYLDLNSARQKSPKKRRPRGTKPRRKPETKTYVLEEPVEPKAQDDVNEANVANWAMNNMTPADKEPSIDEPDSKVVEEPIEAEAAPTPAEDPISVPIEPVPTPADSFPIPSETPTTSPSPQPTRTRPPLMKQKSRILR
ncbi:unnamed protein product, partial [Owenia fusiformis]